LTVAVDQTTSGPVTPLISWRCTMFDLPIPPGCSRKPRGCAASGSVATPSSGTPCHSARACAHLKERAASYNASVTQASTVPICGTEDEQVVNNGISIIRIFNSGSTTSRRSHSGPYGPCAAEIVSVNEVDVRAQYCA
jgi:hypothetical protein